MSGMLAIGLLFAVPLIFLIGFDDDPEEEQEPLGSDGPDVIANGQQTQGQVYDLQGGNDAIRAGSGDDTITNGTGAALIDPGAGNDLINGGDGPITVRDSEGDDTIIGGTGNDFIFDRTGANSVFGGDGVDQIEVGSSSTVTGGAGIDYFRLFLDVNTPSPAVITDLNPEDILLSIVGVEVSGSATGEVHYEARDDGQGANILFGDRVLAEVMGATVEDLESLSISYGLEGDADLTLTDARNDFISASLGTNTIDAGLGNDSIWSRGNANDTGDVLRGGAGNDTLSARGITEGGLPGAPNGGFYFVTEQSTLEGGDGDDLLRSYDSNVMAGGAGDDTFFVTVADNIAIDLPPASEITDFVRGEDTISIGINRVLQAEDVSIVPWMDGTGADIMNGDQVLVRVTGGQDLTLADIDFTRGT